MICFHNVAQSKLMSLHQNQPRLVLTQNRIDHFFLKCNAFQKRLRVSLNNQLYLFFLKPVTKYNTEHKNLSHHFLLSCDVLTPKPTISLIFTLRSFKCSHGTIHKHQSQLRIFTRGSLRENHAPIESLVKTRVSQNESEAVIYLLFY